MRAIAGLGIDGRLTEREMTARWEAALKQRYPSCPELSGAAALTAHLHQARVPVAIATSSGPAAVAAKREHNPELFGRMAVVVNGEVQ